MSSSERSTTTLGSEIYDGVSSVGTFYAKLGMGAGSVIGIILLIMGLYFILFNNDEEFANVEGRVVKSQCSSELSREGGRPHVTHKCNVQVVYKFNEVAYTNTVFVNSSVKYVDGQQISLSVLRSNPNDVRPRRMAESTAGSIMFGVALLVIGLCYFNYYMSKRFKPYAAAQGVHTLWRLI